MPLTPSTMEQQPSPSPTRTGRHENASARLWIWLPTQRRRGKSLEILLSKWALGFHWFFLCKALHNQVFVIVTFLFKCASLPAQQPLLLRSPSSFITLSVQLNSVLHSCFIVCLFNSLVNCCIWLVLPHRWQMKWSGKWIWSQKRFSWPRVLCGPISLRVPLILPVARQRLSKHTTMTLSSSANSEMRYFTRTHMQTLTSLISLIHNCCLTVWLVNPVKILISCTFKSCECSHSTQ